MPRSIPGLALVLLAVACSPPPPPRPPPAVTHVAPELGALRVHVHRLVTPAETPQDDDEYHHMSGLTHTLRSAFEVVLARAGYTVVLGRHDPRDVEAQIVASWDNERSGVATLTLEAGGRVIAQISGVVPRDTSREHGEWYMEEGAASLVEAMTRSPAVTALARAVPRKGGLQVAGPADAKAPR
jgi:hypothetical protein